MKIEETWLDVAKKEHHLLFTELDALLKALDRFFILENLPSARDQVANKNLNVELGAARDLILRALTIMDLIIPESNRNAYWFQKFAESKLMDNRKRDMVRAGMYKQDTPEKSLYVLYDSFINFKSLVSDILKTDYIEYMSFKNIGEIISKELRENVFFSPFRQDINPEFDYIENREITEIVRNIADKDIKKLTSIILLHLFRILRYLIHMDHKSLRPVSLNSSLVIFALLKSEIEVFRSYIEKITEELTEENLVMLLHALSYQFSMESKRVFQQELKDVFEKKDAAYLRGRIENSRGILKNLTEQTILQLSRHWNPNIKEEKIFEFLVTRTAQSVKLREDVYVLNRLLMEVQKKVVSIEESQDILKVLMNYMDYFEDFSFKLIRYDDFEEFSNLFYKVRSDCKNKVEFKQFMDDCHHFSIFLDTTLRQIQNRAELKDRDLKVEKLEAFVEQYLPLN